ncbi:MAG TPA: hypothetical protein EYP88_04775, partial [Anaerolineales bacterium]|nr:hypothetical protein [Anaerolineales bacterium]
SAFVAKTQERVTGTVRIKLYKGNCTVVGRKSPLGAWRRNSWNQRGKRIPAIRMLAPRV